MSIFNKVLIFFEQLYDYLLDWLSHQRIYLLILISQKIYAFYTKTYFIKGLKQASIKLVNIGDGLVGLDFNSGWNCTTIKKGWFFNSTISKLPPSLLNHIFPIFLYNLN